MSSLLAGVFFLNKQEQMVLKSGMRKGSCEFDLINSSDEVKPLMRDVKNETPKTPSNPIKSNRRVVLSSYIFLKSSCDTIN